MTAPKKPVQKKGKRKVTRERKLLRWKEADAIPKPDVIDIERTPCCGASSLLLKRKYNEEEKKWKQDDWFCTNCKKDIPLWFVEAVRTDKTGFVERVQAGIVKAATVKAVQDKAQPEDPKFERQLNKIDAFRAGAKTCREPFVLCPYAQDSELYIPWQQGRERGEEVLYRIAVKNMEPL